MSFCYKYPRPAITVDAVVFAENPEPKVLLIQRKNPPFQGQWAFPGGFVDMSGNNSKHTAVWIETHEDEQFQLFLPQN